MGRRRDVRGPRHVARHDAHDRQRAHRPGVAVAVAGGLPGGARDVPLGDRPDEGVPRLRLHLRLGRLLRVGRGERPGALRARSAQRVAEGRLQIVGGWWIEPDCNIPSGESFVRQALYGQRYLHEKFGIIATTGANIDSFGHNATIPQILARSGIDSYVFLRPGPNEKPRCRRRSSGGSRADGSRVLAYRIPHEYCAPKRRHRRARRQGDRASCPPSADELASSTASATTAAARRRRTSTDRGSTSAGDLPRLELSSLRRFFDTVARGRRLPGRAAASCSTTRAAATRRTPASSAGTAARRTCSAGREVVRDRRRRSACAATRSTSSTRAWKLVLFNQFHDMLAGTAIEPAYDDARDQIGARVVDRRGRVQPPCSRSRAQIAIEQEEEMRPVVVFNPHPWPLRTEVEVEYAWSEARRRRSSTTGAARAVAARAVADDDERAARTRLVFPVEVPPLGYRTYRVKKGTVEWDHLAPAGNRATTARLENDQVLLELEASAAAASRSSCCTSLSGLDVGGSHGRNKAARRRDRRPAATPGATASIRLRR